MFTSKKKKYLDVVEILSSNKLFFWVELFSWTQVLTIYSVK